MITDERIISTHLEGNLIGDPHERDLFVYLPPSYGTSDHRYPAVYLLHAFGHTAADLVTPDTTGVRWSPPLEDVLNPVFERLGAAEMIVVIPDGWSRYGCSQWVDSPVNGNFEQYVVQEVVSFVDERYRTIPRRDSRGVFGFSSGGFGAWHLGSRHPDIFGAMAVLSGDSYFDLTHKPMVYKYFTNIFPNEPNGPLEEDFWSGMTYALASCYSPNVDKPPYFVDLPVAFPSGEINESVWEKWLSYDMVVNWRERSDNLRKLRGILLDVGRNDDADLQWGHRLLSHRLNVAGIPHQVQEHTGSHSGRAPERHQYAVNWLSEVLDHGQ